MSEWRDTTLANVATSIRNGVFAGRPSDEPTGQRILRISAVRDGRVDLADSRYVTGLAADQVERFSLSSGDILMTRYNGSRHLVGIPGIVPDHDLPVVHPDKLIRVVVDREQADSRFINYQLQSPEVRSFLETRIRTTAGQSGISGGDVKEIPLGLPPLDEQWRIVAILDDHLSRLDAADAYLGAARKRLVAMRERSVLEAITGSGFFGDHAASSLDPVGTADGALPSLPAGWFWSRLGQVADVVGGVTKDTKKQSDPRLPAVPYLRVANVQRGRLDLGEVSTIRVTPERVAALRLQPNDVLLNEGGDRDKLARGWVWEGQIETCIHQNHVFRARVTDPRLDPYFLAWTTNSFGGRWAERNGKQSVNLASISLSRIKQMPVIVPPAGVARAVAERLADDMSNVKRLDEAIVARSAQVALLRRSLLSAAFSGQLTSRSPNESAAGVA